MSAHFSQDASLPAGQDNVYPYGKRYAYYVLFLLSLLYFFDFLDRIVVSSLFVGLNRDLGITTEQFGLLTGIVNISIAVLAFPSALLVDRWSRKKMVGTMALVWGFACLACAFSGSFIHLLILRFVVGAGEAGYGPGASSILQSVFPPNKRASALGVLQAASPAGVVIGMVVGGIVAQHFGWRHAFGLVAIPGIIVAFLAFFLKEPPRAKVVKVNAETGQEEKVPLWQILKKIFSTKSLVLIFLAMATTLIFYAVIGVWIPSFYFYTEGLTQQAAGFKGAGVMLAGAFGAIAGGMVADKIGKQNLSLPLKYCALCMLLSFSSFLLGLKVVPHEWSYPCMLVGGFFLSNVLGIAYNAVLSASHKGILATSLGCLIVVQNIFGMGIGATASGFVASYFRRQFMASPAYTELLDPKVAEHAMMAYGLENAIVVMAGFLIIAAVFFFAASFSFKSDCEGAECFE